jgi:DNA-binding LytR/AlgR family response regulator
MVATQGALNWRVWAVATAAGLFLAFVDAFGTDQAPLWRRMAYWLPAIWVGVGVGMIVGPFVSRRPKLGDNPVLSWALVTTITAAPLSVIIWWWTGVQFGARPLSALANFYAPVWLITAAMTALMFLLNRPGMETLPAMPDAPGAPGAPVRFLARLPAKIKGGQIYAVQAEDHYLRVRTSKGADLILLRLSDAVAELDGIEGAQIHRSWWVAQDGFDAVERRDGRVFLTLKDGGEAPVSRANVKALRESGWV